MCWYNIDEKISLQLANVESLLGVYYQDVLSRFGKRASRYMQIIIENENLCIPFNV